VGLIKTSSNDFIPDPDQLTRLFNIYSDEYGDGPAAYARRTYHDWKLGAVRPSAQTINRLLDNLPLVLNFAVAG
jgi:hypothetical protein